MRLDWLLLLQFSLIFLGFHLFLECIFFFFWAIISVCLEIETLAGIWGKLRIPVWLSELWETLPCQYPEWNHFSCYQKTAGVCWLPMAGKDADSWSYSFGEQVTWSHQEDLSLSRVLRAGTLFCSLYPESLGSTGSIFKWQNFSYFYFRSTPCVLPNLVPHL